MRRIRKAGLTIAATGISLICAFLLLELIIRGFFPYNTPDTVRKYSLTYIPSIFARHRLEPVNRIVELDGQKGWGTKARDEPADRSFFINNLGYRGPAISARKEQGMLRIIVLGGSAVFDPWMSDLNEHETNDWPHLVESLLKDRGLNVEVINAGVPGHATFDSLGRLYSQLWMLNPDFVLVYQAWNDIKYFHRWEISLDKPLIDKLAPYDDTSNPFQSYQGRLDYLLSYSQFYVKVRNKYYAWKLRVGEEGVIPEGKLESTYGPFGLKQYRLNLELIVDTARNIGATPILITQASLVSPHNSKDEKALIHYRYQLLNHRALVKAYQETYDVIWAIAANKGVEVLDVARELNGRREFFTDTVHTSPKGSEELAKLVAGFLGGKIDRQPTQRQ